MRRMVVVGLVAGCGRLGFGGDAQERADGPIVDAVEIDAPNDPDAGEPARVVSVIGGLSPLPPATIDLAVTETPSGFTVVWATPPGSNMLGFNLTATTMSPDADWRVTSTRTDYIATTLTWTGSIMTTMTTNAPFTFVKRYVADLSSYANPDGANGIAAKPAYVSTGTRWFWAIVDTTVLHVREMAGDGTPIGNVLDVTGGGAAGAAQGGAFASVGANLYAVWSHNTAVCEWGRIATTPLAATHTPITGSCSNPRIASEPNRAVVVFDDGIELMTMTLDSTGASAATSLASGVNPRLLADPAVGFWVARLDGGALAVARFMPGSPAVTVPLAGLPVGAVAAYELTYAAGKPYLFAVVAQKLWWTQLGS